MKITCFSINPIFPDRITGGASKHLMRLVRHLAENGHQVVILSTEAAAGQEPFFMDGNIQVKPILPFHQPFPQPYQVAPAELSFICEQISSELRDTDRFYIHDGELLLPFLYQSVPTIVSFRDNLYPESVLGSFISQADEIIAVSKYSESILKTTAGRVLPGLEERIHTVINGIDSEKFQPTDPTSVYQKFGINPISDKIVLHPHRPEPGKGLRETIQVVDLLVKEFGFNNLKVLVPGWLEDMSGDIEKVYKLTIQKELQERGLKNNFYFHPWVGQDEMAAYYSAGNLTLSLGNIVEAFGNVAYESLACGTPSLVARVGVHRTQLPDELIEKVDYGDITGTALKSVKILKEGRRYEEEKRIELLDFFNLDRQLESYLYIIENAKKRKPLLYKPISIEEKTRFCLAPWCFLSDKGIYHDYQGRYFQIPALESALKDGKLSTSLEILKAYGKSWQEVFQWYKLGILIPEPNQD